MLFFYKYATANDVEHTVFTHDLFICQNAIIMVDQVSKVTLLDVAQFEL